MSGHAIVIGGGIGGLLIANVLARHYGRVSVLEQARYPARTASAAPPARPGVKQSRCLHMLAGAGVSAFDAVVPGWRQRALALGAKTFDAGLDTAMRFPTGWLLRKPTGITMFACSRALLEDVLAGAAADDGKVQIRQGYRVTGFLPEDDDRRVAGVRAEDRETGRPHDLLADLVADAGGAGSRICTWLGDLPGGTGSLPDESVVPSPWQYVSRWFRLDPADAPDWHLMATTPSGGAVARAAMMLRAEHDFWNVVLLSQGDDRLPASGGAFLDFTRELADGRLAEALKHAVPAAPICHYGRTANRMRHFERLSRWPERLIVTGDAVCTLDPYLGLGMTTAARGAELLHKHLGQNGGRVRRGLDFQRALARHNAWPWQFATGRDLHGRRGPAQGYRLAELFAAAPSHPEVAHAILDVQHLLRPMEALLEARL